MAPAIDLFPGDTLDTLAGWLIGLSAVAAAAAGLKRWAPWSLRPVRWVWRRLVTEPVGGWIRVQHDQALEHSPVIAELRAELVEHSEQLGDIKRQVTPNGGETDTLGDRVVRLEGEAATLRHSAQALALHLAATDAQTEALHDLVIAQNPREAAS